MVAYYRPRPKQRQKCVPKCIPSTVVPSGLGDQGIVGNWLMYYLQGGDHLHDFSPEDNHGTLKNDPVWKDGQYGWMLDLDGNDDYVDCGDIGLTEQASFTVVYWAKVSTSKYKPCVFAEGYPPDWADNLLVLDYGETAWTATPGLDVWQRDGAGTGGHLITYDKDVTDGIWHQVAYVQRALDDRELFFDATSVGTDTTSLNKLDVTYTYIGANNDDGTIVENFHGDVAMLRIYNIAKSASWIKQRYERTKGIFR